MDQIQSAIFKKVGHPIPIKPTDSLTVDRLGNITTAGDLVVSPW